MDRRNFLMFLPWITLAPKIIAKVMISVPEIGKETSFLTESEIIALELDRVNHMIPSLFAKDDVFYAALAKHKPSILSTKDMWIPLQIKPSGVYHHDAFTDLFSESGA